MRYRLRHDKLRRELARQRISQNRWAQKFGLSKSHLSMLVNGQRPYPEASTRRKLQEGLGVRFDELFDRERRDDPPPERNLMEQLLQDIRHGWRALRARPLFVSIIVLTLSLGIGATTAMYSVIDATILRPLPFEQPERLVRIFGASPDRGITRGQLSMASTLDWRQRTVAFEALATYRGRTFNVSGAGEPERTLSVLMADQYLQLLGIRPALGRVFSASEHRSDGPAVAMISDAMWERRFDRDQAVLGRSLRVDTAEHVIVGVLPPAFASVRLTLGWEEAPDLVLPLAMDEGVDRSGYWQLGRQAGGRRQPRRRRGRGGSVRCLAARRVSRRGGWSLPDRDAAATGCCRRSATAVATFSRRCRSGSGDRLHQRCQPHAGLCDLTSPRGRRSQGARRQQAAAPPPDAG